MILDGTKYNIIRTALSSETEEHDVISVKPMSFAIKKELPQEVKDVAITLLEDPTLSDGLTPLHTIETFKQEKSSKELITFILLMYAIAVKEGWLYYSTIKNKYYLNTNNEIAKEYAQDMQNKSL